MYNFYYVSSIRKTSTKRCFTSQTSIIVARLVAQGRLSYSEKISTYWPEFAQGNKHDVTLKDLVSSSGMTV